MRNKMSNKQLFSYHFFVGGALAMLLMAGCAAGSLSTANMKISEGEKAISVARESYSGTNNSVDLRNAEDKLAQANSAATEGEYLTASRLAEKATVDADCARIQAKAEKAKQDAEKMRQNNRKMRQELERVTR